MAENKKKKKSRTQKLHKMHKIHETENSKFGQYKEDRGGGSPKGGMYGGRSGRVGWDRRIDEGEVTGSQHRKDQPRTSDGKFTYNSTNGKPLHQKSRGVTVNPLLTGGENGIKIKDVEKEFAAKKGYYYNRFKDNAYQKKTMLVTRDGKKWVIKLSGDAVWDVAKRSWDVSKNEFTGESKVFSETKKGNPGVAGAIAKRYAKKTKSEQFVRDIQKGQKDYDPKGSIKVMDKYANKKAALTGMLNKLNANAGTNTNVNTNTSKPSTSANVNVNASNTANTVNNNNSNTGSSVPQLKHTPEQIAQIRQMCTDNGMDTSNFTDEQIDNIADEFFDFN